MSFLANFGLVGWWVDRSVSVGLCGAGQTRTYTYVCMVGAPMDVPTSTSTHYGNECSTRSGCLLLGSTGGFKGRGEEGANPQPGAKKCGI